MSKKRSKAHKALAKEILIAMISRPLSERDHKASAEHWHRTQVNGAILYADWFFELIEKSK